MGEGDAHAGELHDEEAVVEGRRDVRLLDGDRVAARDSDVVASGRLEQRSDVDIER